MSGPPRDPRPYKARTTGAPVSLAIPLMDLAPTHCRWIEGDDATFCGHPKAEGSSYCPAHAFVAVRPQQTSTSALERSLRRYAA